MRSPFAAAVLSVLPLVCAAPPAQEAKLLGSWLGTSEGVKGEKLIIEKGVLVVNGQRVAIKELGAGALQVGPDAEDKVYYLLQGDVLEFELNGDRETYKRDGALPAQEPPPAVPDNPLKRGIGAPLDRFARAFAGKDIALELQGGGDKGYRGKLVFQGNSYQAEARAEGDSLRGRFQVGADWFDFTAALAGDKLTLVSGGTTYELAGAPLAGAAPAQAGDGKAPPELTGVFAGATGRYEHPRGWFAFDMPVGWTVYQQSDLGMVLNPGLKQTDAIDAIVGLMWGRLEPQEQDQPVGSLIEKQVPRLRQLLAEQGLQVGEPEAPVATFKGKDVPGAVVTFRGRAAQGQQLVVWFGGIKKRDSWIAVSGVVLGDKAAAYLPQVKRIFVSLEPRPPERNPKLEVALVGKSFSSSQYGRVTGSASHATYSFAGGGVVTRRLMTNIPSTPGLPGGGVDAERSGRYEVCGDVLYLYFETGQEAGQVLMQGNAAVGIKIGNAEYR